MTSLALNSAAEQRNVDKYKLKANHLFEKLQNLQHQSQGKQFKRQKTLVAEYNTQEKKVFQSQKTKEGWYARILEMVRLIETQVNDQRTEAQKCRRSIHNCVESTMREFNTNLQRLQKERKKSEVGLEGFIEGRVQSFVLKNKQVWNECSLVSKDAYLQEIDFLRQEHKKFISEFEKQCDRLKKETVSSLKDCVRLAEEEINGEEEDQIVSLMKSIHMEMSSKVKSLREERERTEERVLAVLEKVILNISHQSS